MFHNIHHSDTSFQAFAASRRHNSNAAAATSNNESEIPWWMEETQQQLQQLKQRRLPSDNGKYEGSFKTEDKHSTHSSYKSFNSNSTHHSTAGFSLLDAVIVNSTTAKNEDIYYPGLDEIDAIPDVNVDELFVQTRKTRGRRSRSKDVPTGARPTARRTAKAAARAAAAALEEQIEIYPGVFERLRGSDETWQACCEGRMCTVQCMACSQKLTCIDDADFVVCPDCAMVSAIGSSSSTKHGPSSGGVGLGMRLGARQVYR